MRCHKWSPHRKTAPWTQTFVPTGQEGQERTHPESTRGASATDTHPLFRAIGVLGIPRRHTDSQASPKQWWGMHGQWLYAGKTAHKMPKIGCRVKNINKANPSLPRRLATFICMFMSICQLSINVSFFLFWWTAINHADLTLLVPQWMDNRSRIWVLLLLLLLLWEQRAGGKGRRITLLWRILWRSHCCLCLRLR